MRIHIPAPDPSSQEDDFDSVPPGIYHARILDAVLREVKSTGTAFLGVVLLVSGPTHSGARLGDRLYLTDKAAWKMHLLLGATGVERDAAGGIETADLRDRAVQIHVRPTRDGSVEIVRYERVPENPERPETVSDEDIPF